MSIDSFYSWLRWVFENLNQYSDAVVALSVLSTAYFAWRGLSAWKNEAKGKRKYDKASSILEVVIAYSSEMQAVRTPIVMPYELSGDLQEHITESKDISTADELSLIYHNRLEQVNPLIIRLNDASHMADVYFGREIGNEVRDLMSCYNSIQFALREVFAQFASGRNMNDVDPHTLEILFSQRIYRKSGEDYHAARIDKSVSNIKRALKKYVR